MKIALWITFAVLALMWTGTAALMAQLVQWSAAGLAAGAPDPAAAVAAVAAMPAWLAPWVDPAAWAAAQQSVHGVLHASMATLPVIGTAVGWLVPLVWLFWGLGLLVMLVLAGLGHWLIGRWQRRGPPGASPVPA